MSIQGFWGLACQPEKTYSQIVTAPFRLAMASLTDEVNDNKRTSVTVNVDKKEFILCTLIPNKIEQQALNVTFVEGEEVTFSVKGNNAVHLTGNYVFTDDEEDEVASISDEEIESEEEELTPEEEQQLLEKLPAGITLEQFKQMIEQQGESDEEGEEEVDSDEEIESAEEEVEEDDDDEEEEEEEEEEVAQPAAKKKRAAEPAAKEQEQPLKKQKQAAEPKKKEEAKKKEESKKKVVKLPNGLIIEDIKVGEGASCKSGQRVGMRYIGKLVNGKVFDKNTSGKPFSFLLGRGEVIKGWDIGVAGMKVGGERKLTVPAPLAYGKRGAPPDIPKNATLVFDVKLVSMK